MRIAKVNGVDMRIARRMSQLVVASAAMLVLIAIGGPVQARPESGRASTVVDTRLGLLVKIPPGLKRWPNAVPAPQIAIGRAVGRWTFGRPLRRTKWRRA